MKHLWFAIILLLQVGIMNAQSPQNGGNKHYKKKMIPRGVEFVTDAPLCVTRSIIINKPIDAVWAVIDDTPRYINWFPGLRWGKFEDPKQTGMEAKRLAQLNNYKYYEEMIIYKPMKKWGFTMLESNSGMAKSMSEIISLEKISDTQTKVVYQGGYEFNGIYKYMKFMMRRTITKTWDGALNGLKTFVETGKAVDK